MRENPLGITVKTALVMCACLPALAASAQETVRNDTLGFALRPGMVADSVRGRRPDMPMPPGDQMPSDGQMPPMGERPPMPPGGGQGFPGGGQGFPGGRPGGPGGGMRDMMAGIDTTATDPNAYRLSSGSEKIKGKTYSSSTSDVNVIRVSGGSLEVTDCTLEKKDGGTQNSDASSFFGTNAAVLATNQGSVVIKGGTITTQAEGANGIVAYGGKVDAENVTINCSNRLSRGIHATGGGSITARNLDISTESANSSVIALDRGGGSVNVTGGSYKTKGNDSAVLYSTGELTVNDITGCSEKGEIGVIEGDNFITINNSQITSQAGSNSRGLMILQSGSGDAGEGLNGIITVNGGTLTMTGSETPFIEIVTNVTGKVTLNGVKTVIPSGILMKVDFNQRWRTNGATGVLVLTGGSEYEGDVLTDSYSSAEVTVSDGATWKGAFDKEGTGKYKSLVIDGGTWTLTADSNVDNITLSNNAVINKNGHTLTCAKLDKASGVVND